MEGEVPGGEPGVFPGVGHGQHVGRREVAPLAVAAARAPPGRRRLERVALQPAPHVVAVELLRPDQPGGGLPEDGAGIRVREAVLQLLVERVRLGPPLPECGPVLLHGADAPARREPQPDPGARPGLEPQRVVQAELGPGIPPHRPGVALDDRRVEPVLERSGGVGLSAVAPQVGVVLAEQEVRRAVEGEPVRPQPRVGADHAPVGGAGDEGPRGPRLPGPRVAEPELRDDVELGGLGAPVERGDHRVDVVGVGLGVFHRDVEEPVAREDSCVGDLVFGLVAPARQALADQIRVREGRLRVAVEHPEIGVARDRIEVVVDLLHVLAVVPLLVGHAEQAFLEDAVAAVPQRQSQVEAAALVADPGEPVLAPAIGAGAGLLVRQGAPGVAVGAVILPHRPPLPLAEIGAPQGPRPVAPALLGDPAALRPGGGFLRARFHQPRPRHGEAEWRGRRGRSLCKAVIGLAGCDGDAGRMHHRSHAAPGRRSPRGRAGRAAFEEQYRPIF